jgi:hypothetical protein
LPSALGLSLLSGLFWAYLRNCTINGKRKGGGEECTQNNKSNLFQTTSPISWSSAPSTTPMAS